MSLVAGLLRRVEVGSLPECQTAIFSSLFRCSKPCPEMNTCSQILLSVYMNGVMLTRTWALKSVTLCLHA